MNTPRALSPRQLEILELVGEGLTNPQIAERLRISDRTVMNTLGTVFARLGVENRLQAAHWLWQQKAAAV